MKVLVTGGTGFIGADLCKQLSRQGHQVKVLTFPRRKQPSKLLEESIEFAEYSFKSEDDLPAQLLEEADGVINLAGAPIFGKAWTNGYKSEIKNSRLNITNKLVSAMSKAKNKPKVLVSASAIGYYGATGSEKLTEAAVPGKDFLADVCIEWERAANQARDLGVRVATVRTGIVLGKGGGALDEMIRPFKFFAGGPLGDGKQWVSWIHKDDLLRIYTESLTGENYWGPINAAAPNPVTYSQLAQEIGRALGRPSWMHAPGFALRLLLGERADILLTGQRVIPKRLEELGFNFEFSELRQALADILGQRTE